MRILSFGQDNPSASSSTQTAARFLRVPGSRLPAQPASRPALSPAAATPVHPPPHPSRRYESATASPGLTFPRRSASREKGAAGAPGSPGSHLHFPRPPPPAPRRPSAEGPSPEKESLGRRAEGGGGGTDTPPLKHEAERPPGRRPPAPSRPRVRFPRVSRSAPWRPRLPDVERPARAARRLGAEGLGHADTDGAGARTRPPLGARPRVSTTVSLSSGSSFPRGRPLTDRDQVGARRPVVYSVGNETAAAGTAVAPDPSGRGPARATEWLRPRLPEPGRAGLGRGRLGSVGPVRAVLTASPGPPPPNPLLPLPASRHPKGAHRLRPLGASAPAGAASHTHRLNVRTRQRVASSAPRRRPTAPLPVGERPPQRVRG
ncbi:uncharacterized protein LOC132220092 [Myotis daubentonii]|uniref:uncharacterized protein LOC132220092 n=1 Tax=Myotis daubentonii TaxID=98922 RepID=UPI0028738C9B|nr:uncharacterized protein LOC132220092 [Myotis daubentonii]